MWKSQVRGGVIPGNNRGPNVTGMGRPVGVGVIIFWPGYWICMM